LCPSPVTLDISQLPSVVGLRDPKFFRGAHGEPSPFATDQGTIGQTVSRQCPSIFSRLLVRLRVLSLDVRGVIDVSDGGGGIGRISFKQNGQVGGLVYGTMAHKWNDEHRPGQTSKER